MVRSFRHKGLQRLFQHDDGSRLPPEMVARIRLILSTLHAAQEIAAMDIPTFRLHPLKGELKGFFQLPSALIGGLSFVLKAAKLSTLILSITIRKGERHGDEESGSSRPSG
jgi:plasmid maintenance system killer protein